MDQQIETYSIKFSKPEPFPGLNAIKTDWLAEHGNGFVSWSGLNAQLKRLSSRVVDLMLNQFHTNAKVLSEYIETVEKRLFESTRKIHELEQALAEQKTAKSTAFLDSYKGTWQPGASTRGNITTWNGSLWICLRDTDGKPEASEDWKLICKRGRDGKDLRT